MSLSSAWICDSPSAGGADVLSRAWIWHLLWDEPAAWWTGPAGAMTCHRVRRPAGGAHLNIDERAAPGFRQGWSAIRFERDARRFRPSIFLDVDGPLITFKARPVGHDRSLGTVPTGPLEVDGNPLLDRLDAGDGRRLLALGCQLVWATTWMADANEVISPRCRRPV